MKLSGPDGNQIPGLSLSTTSGFILCIFVYLPPNWWVRCIGLLGLPFQDNVLQPKVIIKSHDFSIAVFACRSDLQFMFPHSAKSNKGSQIELVLWARDIGTRIWEKENLNNTQETEFKCFYRSLETLLHCFITSFNHSLTRFGKFHSFL